MRPVVQSVIIANIVKFQLQLVQAEDVIFTLFYILFKEQINR